MNETLEEIRARLWHDANVQKAIQLRAYEIWILRGRTEGRHHEDWFLAENEVLNFLVEEEAKRLSDAEEGIIEEVKEIIEEIAAAENEGMIIEPVIVAEYVIEEGAPVLEADVTPAALAPEKKTRKRAATKAKATKIPSKKATAADSGDQKTASSKSASKRTTTTRKAASKKNAKPDQPVAD
jgi:hypothetical protein